MSFVIQAILLTYDVCKDVFIPRIPLITNDVPFESVLIKSL